MQTVIILIVIALVAIGTLINNFNQYIEITKLKKEVKELKNKSFITGVEALKLFEGLMYQREKDKNKIKGSDIVGFYKRAEKAK